MVVQDAITPSRERKLAEVTNVCPGEDGCVSRLQLLVGDSALDDQRKRLREPVHLEKSIHSHPA